MKRRRRWEKRRRGLGGLALVGLLCFPGQPSQGAVAVSSSGPQTLVVTIEEEGGETEVSRLAAAERLWEQGRHQQAAVVFQEIMEGEALPEVKAKAHYKVAYYHLAYGPWEQAEIEFSRIIANPAADVNTVAWSQYCLAWMAVNQHQFSQALARYQEIIDQGKATEEAVYAWSYYEIGRVYLHMLQDREKAQAAFQTVMGSYPDSTPAQRRCWQE